MIIRSVEHNSIAQKIGLLPGDQLLYIDGQPIRDPIDFQFHSAEDVFSITLKRGDAQFEIEVNVEEDAWFGAEFEEIKYRSCGNKCVFCFVDQNPKKLRDTLYFKDEDFRLSFLYGNYVTLTNITRKDLDRIAQQRLSPLYLSVHSTEWSVRQQLLGIKKDDHLLEKLDFLSQAGIEMHTQIVLCPGWNDGPHLEVTIDDLVHYFPAIQTIAIVPVGLTGHRSRLTALRPVDAEAARELLLWEEKRSREFIKKLGTHFIYVADEFYLLAGQELPPAQRYENFAQIENGVGLTRSFIDQFNRLKKGFPKQIAPKHITLVTGQMAAPVLQQKIIPALEKIAGLTVSLAVIENHFYGGGVTVSGLLVGSDIAGQLRHKNLGDLVVLPPNCLNHDLLFLDDWDVPDLEAALKTPVFKPEHTISEVVRYLKKL